MSCVAESSWLPVDLRINAASGFSKYVDMPTQRMLSALVHPAFEHVACVSRGGGDVGSTEHRNFALEVTWW